MDQIKLDTSGFERLITVLSSMGGNVKQAVERAMQPAAEKVSKDTENAISAKFLPAEGKYSKGTTRESIIRDTRIRWEGSSAWVPIGFDFSMPGAGGYLITGTPKMRPDMELNKMFRQKKYMKEIEKMMSDSILESIVQEGQK